MGRPIVNLIGKKFGKLTVLTLETTTPKVRWGCICECGNKTHVDSGNLKKGNVKSCGCLVKENKGYPKDLLGQKFHRLLVIEFSHVNKKGNYNWLCVCDCGEVLVVRGDSLTTGNTKSCGCLKLEKVKDPENKIRGNQCWNWKGGISIEYPVEWNTYLREYIRNRDNRTCQYPDCCYSDVDGANKLDVHHIDGNKNNCFQGNLISLCRSHHSHIENTDPRSWEEYFYSITADYEFRVQEIEYVR